MTVSEDVDQGEEVRRLLHFEAEKIWVLYPPPSRTRSARGIPLLEEVVSRATDCPGKPCKQELNGDLCQWL